MMFLTREVSTSHLHLPRSASIVSQIREQTFRDFASEVFRFRERGPYGRGGGSLRAQWVGAGLGERARVPAYRTPVTMRAAARTWSQEMASPVSRAAEDMPKTGTSSV